MKPRRMKTAQKRPKMSLLNTYMPATGIGVRSLDYNIFASFSTPSTA